ncbi:hypothetical protein F503_03054 [Ophiostoma piceae UAMH 11346]|uniref:Uncharacterized protein n=1 Tax=Ophiostoma piceae (strain UAMH 11346) TaxID=1262450 RepID=S3CZ75_OPHP1|nr:hypothetical protein F503_03054 [Ophiostoma piceae UAMH 11346]
MMKPRRNTADSEPGPGSSNSNTHRNSLSKKPNRPSGTSLEMNAWPRRYTPLQSKAPDTPTAAQLQPLELRPQSSVPPSHAQSQSLPQTPLSPHSQYYQQYQQQQSHHDSWRGSQSTFQPPPSHRASATSSHDGNGKRNSRRGSRNSRTTPTHMPAVDFTTDFSTDFDGEDLFYPLSPAPIKKPDSAKTPRTTRGDDSEILPPDDRNYPVQPFRIASTSTLASQSQGQGQRKSQSGVTMPPPTAAPLRIIHTSPTGPPSIYWSDDNASQAGTDSATIRTNATATNPSAFTFYREDPDDDSDGDEDNDTRRQNRASRRFSRLSRITSSTIARDNDKSEKRRSLRDIGLAVTRSITKDKDKGSKEKESKEKESGRVSGEPDTDDELEDGFDADGLRLEGRQTAEFEFVNGRYVPPALRNGRAPGRKPVNEGRELQRERERKRKLNMSGALGGSGGFGSSRGDVEQDLGGDGNEELDVYSEGRGQSRPSFWVVSGMVLFFIVAIAVGVGVGVGLTMSRG